MPHFSVVAQQKRGHYFFYYNTFELNSTRLGNFGCLHYVRSRRLICSRIFSLLESFCTVCEHFNEAILSVSKDGFFLLLLHFVFFLLIRVSLIFVFINSAILLGDMESKWVCAASFFFLGHRKLNILHFNSLSVLRNSALRCQDSVLQSKRPGYSAAGTASSC